MLSRHRTMTHLRLASLLVASLLASTAAAQTPTINLWHGPTQTYGTKGNPQRWVNLLGNVTNNSVVTSLTYSLNGGTPVNLNMGPDTRRLLQAGDFNIDIDTALLLHGTNTVLIKAVYTGSNVVTSTVTLNYTSGNTWPTNYAVYWGTVTKLTDVVQIVDGRWDYTSAGTRPIALGYDRAFTVGDLQWNNFTVVVPITIHGIDPSPNAHKPPSYSPGFGFTGRWTGHTQLLAGEQPLAYWLPQGGGPWYDIKDPSKSQIPELYLAGSDGMKVPDPYARALTFGNTYWWKLRVETLPSGRTWYGFKLWPTSGTEPALWEMSGTEGPEDLQSGSVIFVAHHVDATVGNITVSDLANDITPPQILNVEIDTDDTLTVISWETDEPASSAVDFGLTSGYALGQVGSSSLVTKHSVALQGLTPSTLYHFKITSHDGRSNSASSSDTTFTTKTTTSGGGLPNSTLATDDFNGTALDTTKWLVVDPYQDGTFNVRDGKLRITATAAATHDVWFSNELPRVMRAAPDVDFDIRAEFDSTLSSVPGEFRSQGILIEQDASNVIRIEFHSIDGQLKLFVATLFGSTRTTRHSFTPTGIGESTPTMHLRVVRSGNTWTVSYSTNGTSWTAAPSFTQAMVVNAIGLYAGNSQGSNHTAVIDAFTVQSVGSNPDTTPPVLSAIAASPAASSATVTWTTDEPADSKVEFGTTTAYGQTVTDTFLRTSHSLNLTGLAPKTLYHYRVVSKDDKANEATSTDRTFTTTDQGLPTSQLASDTFNSSTLDDKVWLKVDPFADGTFAANGSEYSITAAAGRIHDPYTGADVPAIKRQAPNSDFEFHVKYTSSLVASGNPFRSQGILIHQDDSNLLRLEFHSINGSPKFYAGKILSSALSTISNFAMPNLAAPMFLRVKRVGNAWTVSTSANGTSWSVASTFSLTLNVTAISLYAGGSDQLAHTAKIDDFYVHSVGNLPDTTPPTITNIAAVPGTTSATITWSTNEDATSSVDYGATTSYGNNAASAALSQAHSVELTGLTPNTTYHFRVTSEDAAHNSAGSSDLTFATKPLPSGGTLVSDAFTSLDTTRWQLVNPLNDATSAAAAGGKVTISLPSSTLIRDVWTSSNTLPRLMQNAPDVDFDIEAEFTSGLPSSSFRSHGMLIEQDPLNVIRVEYLVANGSTAVFVATIFNGNAVVRRYQPLSLSTPMSLRVARVGDNWTITRKFGSSSYQSVASFSQPMTVTRVGMHAGSANDTHSVSIESFTVHSVATPDTTPPVISNVSVTPGQTAATVTWTTDEPATSKVAYGLTNTFEIGEVGSNALSTSHTVQLTGLTATTLYHFKVISADGSNNSAASSGATFTTTSSGGGTPVIRSDNFTSNTIDPSVWTFIDPLSDSTVSASGQQVHIATPAVAAIHDVWTTSNTLPRLMQAAPNTDWEIEAKFTSTLTGSEFKSHGILVEQDPLNVLRIEFHTYGGQTNLFVASILAGNATVRAFKPVSLNGSTYLRVTRSGSGWTIRYSLDGNNWPVLVSFTQAMVPDKVGVFAGSGANTAHTASIDYFHNTANRP